LVSFPPEQQAAARRHAAKHQNVSADTLFRDKLADGTDGPEMVALPAGTFQMGDHQGVGEANEKPVHAVKIPRPFALGRYEVTVEEFTRFVNATKYVTEAEQNSGGQPGCLVVGTSGEWDPASGTSWRNPGFAQGTNQPVVCVSWNDAKAYTAWLSAQSGKAYRLPTEAEWEYAARAGSSASYPWGNSPEGGCASANGSDLATRAQYPAWTTSSCNDGHVYTAPVGAFQSKGFSLHDMVGNVFEWTEDCVSESYAGAPSDGQASTGGDCSRHGFRGGSWNSRPTSMRLAFRYSGSAVVRTSGLGLRIARDLP
jgi:formylglycine-generating enzyme required for sulfatase activity